MSHCHRHICIFDDYYHPVDIYTFILTRKTKAKTKNGAIYLDFMLKKSQKWKQKATRIIQFLTKIIEETL